MNGEIINTQTKKTVMWGVKSKNNSAKKAKEIIIALIGVIRPSHGLDIAFDLLKSKGNIKLKVLGECNNALYTHYLTLMNNLGVRNQVEFKNKFYSEKEIAHELKNCIAGIALYNTDKNDPIYYTDPGKVKTYTEYGIPVIMTNTSEIAPFIKKFNAGKIISRNSMSLYNAIIDIKKHYNKYLEGVRAFNTYFNYQRYYKKRFKFMENKYA